MCDIFGDIARNGGKAIAVKADVAKKADIDHLFAESRRAFGRLDILVNNAGIYEFSPLENVTEAPQRVKKERRPVAEALSASGQARLERSTPAEPRQAHLLRRSPPRCPVC